jgi:O-antigen ligase
MTAIASHPSSARVATGAVIAVLVLLCAILYVAEPLDLTFSVGSEDKAVGNVDENVQSVEEGSPRRRLGLLALLGFGAVALLSAKEPSLKMQGLLGYAILALLLWSAASIAWSDDPGMTARKIAALACLATGALGVARLLSWRQLTTLVFASAGIQLLVGLGAEIALGTFRPLAGGYQYTGLGYPAFTAWSMSLLVLSGAALWRRAEPTWRLGIGALMLAATLALFMTKSRTPAIAFVIAALTFIVVSWPARRTIFTVACLGLVASLGFVLVDGFVGDVFEVLSDAANLGREKESIGNLTGRTEVWRELLPYIEARPWCGYGYESFWTTPRLVDFANAQGWAVPDAHNGFINFALGIGLPGSLLYTCVLGLAFTRSVRQYARSGNVDYAFAAAVLVAQGVNMLCVAIQMAPYLPCMVAMFVLAKLGFVADASPGTSLAPASLAPASFAPALAAPASIAADIPSTRNEAPQP